MSASNLSDQVVLVTRPVDQQQPLSSAIEQAGGTVLAKPLISITPLQQQSQQGQASLMSKIRDLGNYQLLIFVSSNAARFGARLISDNWPEFPEGVQLMAIGPSTAAVVEDLLECRAFMPGSGMSSEDLLELEQLKQLEGMKIAIVRGKGGRELLARSLEARGAEVDYLEVYERQPINYESAEFCDSLRQSGTTVMTVTSGESLEVLASLLISGDNKQEFSLLPLLVPSERVAQLAEEAGFANVFSCRGADTESMIQGLQSITADGRLS
jgi:uroporphyrinogen-III synthase